MAWWILVYFGYLQSMQPWGMRWLFQLVAPFGMVLGLLLALMTITICVDAARRGRRAFVFAAFAVVVSITALVCLPEFNWRVRRHAIERFVPTARPVIDALKKYELDHGRPAESLQTLMPQYLSAIPETGFGAFPTFEYVVGDARDEEDGWSLRVPLPLGFLNWDMLIYLPSQHYPAIGYGGRLERFQEWAYVHE